MRGRDRMSVAYPIDFEAPKPRRTKPKLRSLCTCGECMSCKMRRLWAEGRFDGRAKGFRWDAWTEDQDEWLGRHVGTVEIDELARRIGDEFGIPRTPDALEVRAKRLELSLWKRCYTMTDIETIFRFDHRAVLRNWVRPGHLVGRRWSGRGPNRGWWFEFADVELFVRGFPWLYKVDRMKPGHRLTSIAQVVHRSDPWGSYAELAAYVGINTNNLDRWRSRGLVPHQRRPRSGGNHEIVVRRRDFRAIKEAIDHARAEAMAEGKRKQALIRWAGVNDGQPFLRAIYYQCRVCGRLIDREEKARSRGRVVVPRGLVCERCKGREG